MSNKKHYILTSITLGLIAAISGLAISLTNMVTKDRIANNEKQKINDGIYSLFGSDVKVNDEKDVIDIDFETKYVTSYYKIDDLSENLLGYAYKTNGSNSYGKISLIVAINASPIYFKGISVINNEQTYATTLNNNYIDKINDGSRDINDVSCGATYGAKLVKEMIEESLKISEIM